MWKPAAAGLFTGSFTPKHGREVLEPLAGAEVLARFKDGKPAAIRNRCGEGEAYLIGVNAGAEYRGDPGRLTYVSAPALKRVTPPLDISQPTVEGILIRNLKTGKRAIVLINWSYAATAGPGFADTKVAIRRPGDLAPDTAFSVALAREIPLARPAGALELTIPDLREVDILLLE